MFLHFTFTVTVAFAILSSVSAKASARPDFRYYKTEPGFLSNNLRVVQNGTSEGLIQPGYIFVGAYPKAGEQLIGPQIFDSEGELVWWGNISTKSRAQNFHVCNFLGEVGNHLCWSEVDYKPLQGERGWNRIFNNEYDSVARPYRASGALRFPNPHEFHILPEGTSFLQSVYQLKRANLSDYAGPARGFVEDGCFQEIDIETGDAIFTWCGLDVLPLWHTSVFLNIPENVVNHTGEAYGDGTFELPWDYFHLNSVDKTSDGDYIVSARHLNQILKIAGKDNLQGAPPGSIIWRLGGKFNSFDGAEQLDLSKQHHARIIKVEGNETTLTLFNNQWKVNGDHRRISNAQLVVINEVTMTVSSVQKFYQPEGTVSFAQGSTQRLANGNIFVGWGTVPQVTEFSANGTVLSHMHLANYNQSATIDKNQQNYRTFKFSWTGKPKWDPKVMAYTQFCQPPPQPGSKQVRSPLIAYASWNGATDVVAWRFHTSHWSKFGPWIPAGTFPKQGFETRAELRGVLSSSSSFRRFVRVQALGPKNEILGQAISKTFVPDEEVVDDCDLDGCFSGESSFWYEASFSQADACPLHVLPNRRLRLAFLILSCLPSCYFIARRLRRRNFAWHIRKISEQPKLPFVA